jgi:nucleoid DNA-binding protein
MTKKELAQAVSLKTDCTPELSMKMVDAYNYCMVQFLKNGHSVYLRGFATFEVVTTKAKKGRNITKGTSVHIPEKKKVKFKKSGKWEIKDASKSSFII